MLASQRRSVRDQTYYGHGSLLPTFVDPATSSTNLTRLSHHYGFVKPNDIRALNLINAAAQHTLHILPDVILAYGHSDEYSFVFHKSCSLFERRSAKIASTVVSTFTSAYVHLWKQFFDSPPVGGTFFASAASEVNGTQDTSVTEGNTATELDISYLPSFDARCISYPSNSNLRDYLSWRQADCHINNLYNTAFWALVLRGGMSNTEAEEFLKGTVSSDKNEMLWSKFNVNYNSELEIFKKGSVVMRAYALVDLPDKNGASGSRTMLGEDKDGDAQGEDSSKTQKEKMKRTRQKAKIVVEHLDIIKDDFWLRRPWLLSGKPGNPIAADE